MRSFLSSSMAGGALVAAILGASAAASAADQLPAISSDLPEHACFNRNDAIRVVITITDADGEHVAARLIDGPREMFFEPITDAPSGATRELLMYPSWRDDGGRRTIVVEAWTPSKAGTTVRREFAFHVGGCYDRRTLAVLDADGDGDAEILARSSRGDSGGVADCGALALFEASAPPPWLATRPDVFTAATPKANYRFDDLDPTYADVTGDGIVDVIGIHDGNLEVWHGGGAGSPRQSDALLLSSDPNALPSLHEVLIDDVTQDGILDLIVAFPFANTSVTDAGEVLVFAGGTALVGTVAPTATLRVPSPVAFDMLGFDGSYLSTTPLRVGDVSGDGIPDIVIVAAYANVGATTDAGKVLVFGGGAALAGTPAPLATLATFGSSKSKQLGYVRDVQGLHLVDVSGDGILDVVAGSSQTSTGGAIWVWNGGAALVGPLDATARLSIAGASRLDNLGETAWELAQGIQFADVTKDGVTDIVAAASKATVAGLFGAGAIYVFAGGSLSGSATETARLRLASPTQEDYLAASHTGLQLVDVTGDGEVDIVECSYLTTTAASPYAGAVHVWAASASLSGDVFPSASLEVPNASTDTLGISSSGGDSTALTIVDVTGDGVRDVIASTPFARINGREEAGAIYVWSGGGALAGGGTLAPTATLVDDAPFGHVGQRSSYLAGAGSAAVRCADIDGDGIRDLIGFSELVHRPLPQNNVATDVGRVLVWIGGAALVGTRSPDAWGTSPVAGDEFASGGNGIDCADLSGDGVLDMLVGAAGTDVGFTHHAGAIYLFAGGSRMRGKLQAMRRLEIPGALPDSRLDSRELVFGDVDGDGALDLVAAASLANLTAGDGLGRLLWFRGPIGPNSVAPVQLVAPVLGRDAHLGE
ncbi:MAG: VCBS repeat-containing protein [Planctomycetes bacterium]|nr:VCBS repeat-containing protein [Planctomycetota bacterium]